jgi:hypothetical protein
LQITNSLLLSLGKQTNSQGSNMRNVAVVLVVCVSLLQQAFGWGDDGHRAINKVALSKVPASMPGFVRKASARIEYLGPEPDRWRHKEEFSVKNAQEADHFIDLERVDDVPELPQGRYAFYRLLYEKRAALLAQNPASGISSGNSSTGGRTRPDDLLPEKVGLQPYIALEIYDRLKVAFREYRHLKFAAKDTKAVEQNAVFYMGWLGHYVGDAANPLHTTVQYNGWIGPNPNGYTVERKIHFMMESAFVTANIAQMPLANLVKAPTKLNDPWRDYIGYLRTSNTMVEKCYQLEKAGGFVEAGTPESREFIRQRLAAGAQMLVDMWYTAWIESEKEPERPKYD